MRIRNALLVSMFAMSIVFIATEAVLFNFLHGSYSRALDESAAQLLSVVINAVDAQLKQIEDTTFNVLTSETVQECLPIYLTGQDDNVRVSKLVPELYKLTSGQKYINSIAYIDSKGEKLVIGRTGDFEEIDSEAACAFYLCALEKQGMYSWVMEKNSNRLFIIRQIRRIKNLSFDDLGVIAFSVDINRLVNDTVRLNSITATDIVIYCGDDVLYSSALPEEIAELELKGEDYYVIRALSSHTGWSFEGIIAESETYRDSAAAERVCVIVMLISAAVAVTMMFKLSASITRPLEKLSSLMNKSYSDSGVGSKPNSKNEIVQLENSFNLLLNRIDRLITDNYQKQLALKDSRYNALQAQINPHFLYNTLNAVDWMAKGSKNTNISRVVEALARLLRETVNLDSRCITLSEELSLLESYLVIQRTRLQEKLVCTVATEAEAMTCLVPKLIFQPLVENSISYGYNEAKGMTVINVSAIIVDGRLIIGVRDEGPGFSKETAENVTSGVFDTSKHTGIGLRNIYHRLDIAFDGDFAFKVKENNGTRNEVLIELPAKYR